MKEKFQDMNRTWFGRRGLLFLDDFTHKPLEPVLSAGNRKAAYVAGTRRSVGRRWP